METRKIKIADIIVDDRMRKTYSEIDSLAASLREKGQLTPILVNKNLKLRAGGRRLAAAQLNQWEEIEAKISDSAEITEDLEIEFIENHEREDFHWTDYANGIQRIHEVRKAKNGKWSMNDTARVLGISKSGVSSQIRLAEMLEIVPGLSECATEAEAQRKINNLIENVYVSELAEREPEVEEALEQPSNQDPFSKEERAKSKSEVNDLLARVQQLKEEGLTDEDGNKIYPAAPEFILGDFFEAAKEMPNEFLGDYALIECDPPYAIDLQQMKESSNMGDYNEITNENYPEFLQKLLFESYRVMGDNSRVVFWYAFEWYETIITLARQTGFKVSSIPGIWYKPNVTGQNKQPRVNLSSVCEPFLILRKGMPILGKFGAPNVFAVDAVPPNEKIHPTERPVELIKQILSTVANPTSVSKCLVPFLGSGNTLFACRELGISAWGYELSKTYRDNYIIRK